jgi:hypothetical protein
MSKRKNKEGLPPLEDETNSPLPTLESREGMSIEDEIALCRETQDNPLTADDLGTAIVQIKIDRPKKNHYFRVMTPPQGRGYLQMHMIDGASLSGVPKNWYVITTALAKSLQEYGKGIKKFALVPTIDRDGNIRVWPHSLASEGQAESWFESRTKVIGEATQKWIRFEANSHESRYEIIPARDQSLDPKWPLDLGYDELITKAIGEHYVTSLNHPVIRSLRGDSLHKVEADG